MRRREVVPGTHDFDGVCRPEKYPVGSYTFSVGIFRWLKGTRGIKRGRVFYRVRGFSSDPKRVYRRAEQLCEVFDKEVCADPEWPGPCQKSEWVRWR